MDIPLFKALVAFFPASLLFSGSAILWFRGKTLYSFMQLVGAGCLVMVVLTHLCEALNLFPNMNWGLEHSAGHYMDLAVALAGLTLFPLGYLLHVLSPAQKAG